MVIRLKNSSTVNLATQILLQLAKRAVTRSVGDLLHGVEYPGPQNEPGAHLSMVYQSSIRIVGKDLIIGAPYEDDVHKSHAYE